MSTKNATLHLYPSLSDFLSEVLPAIRLRNESEKATLIEALAGSETFHETHLVVARLLRIEDFSDEQAREIADAVIENNQVHWIIGDPDVRQLAERLLEVHSDALTDRQGHGLATMLADLEVDEAIEGGYFHDQFDGP